jgi:GNAT superfamily N-acetyltransferase
VDLDVRVLSPDDAPAVAATIIEVLTELSPAVADVDEATMAQGGGVGRAMMLHLHEEARRAGITQLDLTTRATREAANHLYQSLGYERRETNVYRLTLAPR